MLFNVFLFSTLIFLGYVIYDKSSQYISLKKNCDYVSDLNEQIDSIDSLSRNVSSDLGVIEQEYNEKKDIYDELSKKNIELNSSLNDCNTDIFRYDDMISDVRLKIANYNR